MGKLKIKDGHILNKQRNRTGNFDCSNLGLTSLENSPKKVGGCFCCSYNQLTTLENCPEYVGGDFVCSDNQLTTLKGCPEEVNDFIVCTNELVSLKHCPKKINGRLNICENPLLEDISDIGYVKSGGIDMIYSPNIKVFPKEINSDNGTVEFWTNVDEVKKRIREFEYYVVVKEENDIDYLSNGTTITVRNKTDSEYFMDSL